MEWIWVILGIIALVIIGVISILRWGFSTTKRGIKYLDDKRRDRASVKKEK